MIVLWIACVLVGAFVGFMIGNVLWQMGFELIGSSVALVGAGVGGIVAFLGVLGWLDRRGVFNN